MIQLYIILFLVNLLFIYYFENVSKYINLYDKPDKKRKFHKKKIANIGGCIIFFNLFIFFIYYLLNKNYFYINNLSFSEKEFFIFFIFSSFFFILGFLDDKFLISPNIKLFIFASILYFLLISNGNILVKQINFSFLSSSFDISKISFLFTLISFLLFINAFNMFDGINLQAGIYSLFLLVIFLIINFSVEILLVLILPLLTFLYLNYKNKCFLGDNGSLLIAFILSFLFIKCYNQKYIIYADQIFLLMLIPGLDLLRLAIIRILDNKHPFQGDRNHFHHEILEKFGLNRALLIIFSIIIVPNILSLILGGTLYFVVLSTALYFSLLFYLKKYI
jgi:UDP-GlcNAc:undecaprenyl-phosphate GlcNAc-1-phosphate transferase